MTMHQMLAGTAQGVQVDPKIIWAPASFLEANQVSAWSDMPVWASKPGRAFGFHRRDTRRAIAEGLTYRPAGAHRCRHALPGFVQLPSERQSKLRAGLTPEREAELLAKRKIALQHQ